MGLFGNAHFGELGDGDHGFMWFDGGCFVLPFMQNERRGKHLRANFMGEWFRSGFDGLFGVYCPVSGACDSVFWGGNGSQCNNVA